MENVQNLHQKHSSAVYRGIGHITGDPIAGKLRFGTEPDGTSARIAVLWEDCSDERIRALCEEPSTVALLFVGETLPESIRTAASLPLMVLEHLPVSHDGEIAILDTAKGVLVVSPDLETMARYAERGTADSPAPLPPPLTGACAAVDPATGGYLLSSLSTELSEEALFEAYRDAAEAAAPAPLLVCLSASADREERETHWRAMVRAAVFGPLTLLWEDITAPEALTALQAELVTAREQLKAEGRETNLPTLGLWVASPLALLALSSLPPVAHLGLDLSRLLPALLGTIPPTADTLRTFFSMLAAAVAKHRCLRSACVSSEWEALFPEGALQGLGIERVFVKETQEKDAP